MARNTFTWSKTLMNTERQIFQTTSRFRWQTFRWFGRLCLFLLVISMALVAIAYGYKHLLLYLGSDEYKKIDKQTQPKGFSANDDKKYQGFYKFLRSHQCKQPKQAINTSRIRAAFYVNWDPQSLYSLQNHIDQLNMVMPDWF